MSVFTLSGRAEVARMLSERELYLAWGRGNPEWDDAAVPAPADLEYLYDEVGRVAATSVGFALPDEAGDIETPSGRYARVFVPTRFLYLKFPFAFADAAGETLRECGVFVGTVLTPGLPDAQRYFEPADVADRGVLVAAERFPAFERFATVRQTFESVFPI